MYDKVKKPEHKFSDLIVDLSNTNYSNLVTFNSNKHEEMHSWFYYKQGFSSKLLPWIADKYLIPKNSKVLDPFCGIGTSLLSAKENGYSSIGVDISPLCTFVTYAKLLNGYNPTLIKKSISDILGRKYQHPNISYPDIKIVDGAFSSDALNKLLFLKEEIEKISDYSTKTFLKMALISIIQNVSFAKRDGAFLRIQPDRPVNDVNEEFKNQTTRMLQDIALQQTSLNNFFKSDRPYINGNGDCNIIRGDARSLPIKDSNLIDMTITSPPYLNRYDYTRIYSPELCLYFVKNFNELRDLRYQTMRSHVEAKYKKTNFVQSDELNLALDKLELRSDQLNNPKIPEMIKGYFEDTFLYLKQIQRINKENAIVAIVAGNARWEGISIPVDLIICEIGEQLGFKPINIFTCKLRSTSIQQVRKYGEEQVREGIIILSM